MNILNEYLEIRQEGMDYSEMYEELNSFGYEKSYIKELINEVDAKYLLMLEQKESRNFPNVLNGIIRLILGVVLLLVLVLYLILFIKAGVTPGELDIVIISLSFTGGSWFFSTGKKALKKQ